MYNLSILHLYVGKDPDFNEKNDPKYNAINIAVPFLLLHLPTLVFKKYISIREYIYEQNYEIGKNINELKQIKNNSQNSTTKKLRIQIVLHEIQTQISKTRNKMESRGTLLFIAGLIFLFFNCYVATCFCGIYNNSYLCLILNTLMSIIFTLVWSNILLLISCCLRKISLCIKLKLVFNFSGILNPVILFYIKDISKFVNE